MPEGPEIRRAADCDDAELRRLGDRITALTRRTYRTRGSTLPPKRGSKLRVEGLACPTYRFWVYGKEGEPCRICGEVITQEPFGGRKCVWCPRCRPCEEKEQVPR